MSNSEEILLCQVLLDNSVIYKTDINVSDFSDPHCRATFQTMKHLSDKDMAIDELTIRKVNDSIDLNWLLTLRDKVPTAANYKYYETIIKNESNKRKFELLSLEIQDSLRQGKKPYEIKDDLENFLMDYAVNNDGWSIKHVGEVIVKTIDLIEERYKMKGELPGITTGIGSLDDLLLGFRQRMFYVVGARPSRGKTALMMNFARAAANNKKVGIISTESAAEELGLRMISGETNINSRDLATGLMQKSYFPRLAQAGGVLYDKPIYIYDEPNASLTNVISACKEMVRLHGVEVIYIDYVQNIEYNGFGTERENIGHVSTRLKSLARSMNIPVIAMAQLRREGDQQYRRPVQGDLLGSGKIEQDADGIILIWWQLTKEEKEKRDLGEPHNFKTWLLVDKARDSETGQVEVKFIKETVKFVEIDRREM